MKDGLQGVSHDRILMRIRDYLTIFGMLAGFIGSGIVWGIHVVKEFDRMNNNISLLQQQQGLFQQLLLRQIKDQH